MKIVFVSNNYNHHERFFCEELNKFSDVEFSLFKLNLCEKNE